ncbi:MAG: adenosine deaminase [Chloroflexi bacterium]|nr:adenosine deaminase [Chloroflexota bacterium]
MEMAEFIAVLPKAEMHVHIEGTIPWAVTRAHSNGDLPDVPDWIHDDFRFIDFRDFGTVIYRSLQPVLTSPQRYTDIAAAYFQSLVEQNVRYVEVSLSTSGTINRGLNIGEVVDAIYAAVPPELMVRVIAGINRMSDVPLNSHEAQIILKTPGIAGLDLHGDERIKGPESFADIFQAAGEQGYLLRAHAGELTDPDVIRASIDVLNLSRIEHGTLAQGDDALIEKFIEEDITLDMCPTSNVKLCVVDSLAAHPIGEFLRRGVRVTCSTDDPPLFNISLSDELRLLVEHQQFTPRELAQLQINAFEAAILPEETRRELIAEVEGCLAEMETQQ